MILSAIYLIKDQATRQTVQMASKLFNIYAVFITLIKKSIDWALILQKCSGIELQSAFQVLYKTMQFVTH